MAIASKDIDQNRGVRRIENFPVDAMNTLTGELQNLKHILECRHANGLPVIAEAGL